MIRRFAHSLSGRLLGIFLLTSILYGVGSRYILDLAWSMGYLSEAVGGHMALQINYVLDDIGQPPDVARAQAIARRVPVDVMLRGPDVHWVSDARFPSLDRLSFRKSDFLYRFASGDEDWIRTVRLIEVARFERRLFVKVRNGDYDIVFASPRLRDDPRPDFATPAIGLLSVLVLALCYLAVRWVIAPMRWIKEGTARIGQGDLQHRIPASRNDDLGDLARNINRMADDVGEMLEAKRQLLLAISHELRSPLTRVKVALEFLDDVSVRDNLMQDVREMERLIADLLESERLNTRHSKLQLSPFDLAELVETVIEHECADAVGRIRLIASPAPVSINADATRLRLLVRNLLENALRYTPPDASPVEVTVSATDGEASILVTDRGRGMSPHDLARATEPFYRADPARSRATGGLGLGLYLCRRIAEAHGGRLELRSELGSGTDVTVTLPR